LCVDNQNSNTSLHTDAIEHTMWKSRKPQDHDDSMPHDIKMDETAAVLNGFHEHEQHGAYLHPSSPPSYRLIPHFELSVFQNRNLIPVMPSYMNTLLFADRLPSFSPAIHSASGKQNTHKKSGEALMSPQLSVDMYHLLMVLKKEPLTTEFVLHFDGQRISDRSSA